MKTDQATNATPQALGSTEGLGAGAGAQEFVLLHALPAGHPLRQMPLQGAQCRNLHSKEWRDIRGSWAIAGASFDQLGDSWTSTTEFRRAPNVRGNAPTRAERTDDESH